MKGHLTLICFFFSFASCFFTSNSTPGVCPDGWLFSLEGCFLFDYSVKTTWRQAQQQCEEYGGFLAEIKYLEQQLYLVV